MTTIFDNDASIAVAKIQSTWIKFRLPDKTFRVGHVRKFRLKDGKEGGTNNLSDYKLDMTFSMNSNEVMSIDSEDFCYTFGKLGYINGFYVSRLPIRKDYKQGLRDSSLCFAYKEKRQPVEGGFISHHLQEFDRLVNGNFKFDSNVLEAIEEENRTIAISHQFAITKNYKLEYRGREVGRLGKDDKLKLDSKFEFLRQELATVVSNEHVSL